MLPKLPQDYAKVKIPINYEYECTNKKMMPIETVNKTLKSTDKRPIGADIQSKISNRHRVVMHYIIFSIHCCTFIAATQRKIKSGLIIRVERL